MRTEREDRFVARSGECVPPALGDGEVIDFDLYLPVVLAKLLGKLRRSADAFFGGRHGITLLEWRILSFVADKGTTSAYAIWTEGELDKAAVSRALREMRDRGLVDIERVDGSRRRKSTVILTEHGRHLHTETVAEVLRRHRRLLGGMSTSEIMTLLETLRAIELRIPLMTDGPLEPCDFRPTKRRCTAAS